MNETVRSKVGLDRFRKTIVARKLELNSDTGMAVCVRQSNGRRAEDSDIKVSSATINRCPQKAALSFHSGQHQVDRHLGICVVIHQWAGVGWSGEVIESHLHGGDIAGALALATAGQHGLCVGDALLAAVLSDQLDLAGADGHQRVPLLRRQMVLLRHAQTLKSTW